MFSRLDLEFYVLASLIKKFVVFLISQLLGFCRT